MTEKKKPSIALGLVAWAAIAAALYGCLFTGEPRVKTEAEQRADKRLGAFIRCENATEARVADPEGMRFAAYADWQAEWGPDEDSVAFTFEVVARNAFGALVSGQMRCAAEYDGQYWKAVEITVQ